MRVPAIRFKSAGGLKSETEVVDFREGGVNDTTHKLLGATKWPNIVLKRGFGDKALSSWRQSWLNPVGKTRVTGKIEQLDTQGNVKATWTFKEAFPAKWEIGEYDASKSEVVIETLTLRGELPAKFEPLVGRAHDDVQRLENLIGNILEGARLDEGRVRLALDRIVLARIVAQTTERLAERARRAGAAFELDVPAALAIQADPVATDAVLRNLIENAIAAIAPRGQGRIRLAARDLGERIELEIRDDGVGFDLTDASRLFEKFSHTDPAYRSSERTGLGLNIAQRLMHLGGGDIRAHSEGLGHGASFIVVWPKAATEAA